MKNITLSFMLLFNATVFAQLTPKEFHGEHKIQVSNVECLSDEIRNDIQIEIQKSRLKLIESNLLQNHQNKQPSEVQSHPLFIWPVVKNPTSPYEKVWSISNYVDHNSAYPNQIQDYNCGTRTYDTSSGYNHSGIDIATWPFSWYQFQNNQSWAVAAASGTIIYKSDGKFDMNCSLNGSNWNAVYVEHLDGSIAWYGHLKNASLTTKAVGAQVVAGEFLGVIGSSGNSTGPHLHFEVYNSSNQLVDPYFGTCNNWTSNTDSWWAAQKPYLNPSINAVLTHNLAPVFGTCPTTEEVNFKDVFNNGDNVISAIYLTDQAVGTSGTIALIRPDGTTAYSYVKNFTSTFQNSYVYWDFPSNFFNQMGEWTFTFSYLGTTVAHVFSYGTLKNENFNKDFFAIYPNPSNDFVNIRSNSSNKIEEVLVFDVSGKQIYRNDRNVDKIDVSLWESGVYFFKISSDNITQTNKVIRN